MFLEPPSQGLSSYPRLEDHKVRPAADHPQLSAGNLRREPGRVSHGNQLVHISMEDKRRRVDAGQATGGVVGGCGGRLVEDSARAHPGTAAGHASGGSTQLAEEIHRGRRLGSYAAGGRRAEDQAPDPVGRDDRQLLARPSRRATTRRRARESIRSWSSTETASSAIVAVVMGRPGPGPPEPRWSTAMQVNVSATSSSTPTNAGTGTTYPEIQSSGGPEPRTVNAIPPACAPAPRINPVRAPVRRRRRRPAR